MTKSDLELYAELVQSYFEFDSSNPFKNKGADHAKIVIKNIFLYAEEDVMLLSDSLNFDNDLEPESENQVYSWEGILFPASMFIASSTAKLHILLHENYSEEDILKHPFVRVLRNMKEISKKQDRDRDSGELIIKHISKDITKGENFIVADGKAYRKEEDLVQHTATPCANDPKYAKELTKDFKRYWQQATHITTI